MLFDVAIIGAGVVGSAIARELARYELKIALIDANPDVGMGTSKANTAIWHTGYDATPGSLESRLLKRSYPLLERFMPGANIPHERLGGLLLAWNEEQLAALPALLEKAHQNGDDDVQMISATEIMRREPHLNPGVLGGLFIPREGILCTYSVTLACAYQAVMNGTQLFLNFQVKNVRVDGSAWMLGGEGQNVRARYVVNAAGLYSDEIHALFGHRSFKVTPRRGQLIIYDKLSRPLINHVLLPVPTPVTKGVLITPTVYGNILLGPTAEELDDKTATQTTADGLKYLTEMGRNILPELSYEEVTATYSGLRAATQHGDYQIEMHEDQRYLCVGGIRSTGISGSLGIAENAAELLQKSGLELKPKPEFKPVKMPAIGQAQQRPHQNPEMIARDPSYAQIICHCERVSKGELRDAIQAPIPATTLDGLRRRTRASQGRCQGFNCHAALFQALDAKSSYPKYEIGGSLIRRNAPIAKVADVLIVGAGPAGLSAAIELKSLGIKNVLVVDREPEAGGMPRLCHHTGFGCEDLWRMYSGPRYAQYYRELAEKAGIEILTSTTVTNWGEHSDHKNLSFTSPHGLGSIDAQAVLLATGVRERPRHARLIPGKRPQGIYTTGSLQRFVYQEHLPVGQRAVIVGAELVSLSALLTLMHAGVRCEMLLTEHPRHQVYFPYLPMKWILADVLARAPIIKNVQISNIFGGKRVEGIEFLDENAQKSHVECDAVVFTGDWIPEHELARNGRLSIDPGTYGPCIDENFRTSEKGVFAAGNLLRGVATADHCAREGKRAAASITQFLRSGAWHDGGMDVEVAWPLVWVTPNIIQPGEAVNSFLFRSHEFIRGAELQVMQAGRRVHSQHFRSIVVNEIMKFNGTWVHRLDPAAGPVKLELV